MAFTDDSSRHIEQVRSRVIHVQKNEQATQQALIVPLSRAGGELADHDGQLSRYFNATPSVTVAVITDGVRFRAFTDLRTPNIMDSTRWFASSCGRIGSPSTSDSEVVSA